MVMAKRTILIVDDHQMFADGIRFLIERTTDYEVVMMLTNGRDVISFLEQHSSIDVLLLDIDLPDTSGFDLAKRIRQTYSTIKILALSMLNDAQSIGRMMEAGANGYCIKSAGSDELFAAIRAVNEGQLYLPPEYVPSPANTLVTGLSGRETEIIQLIAEGFSTKQIAEKLFLSARTIETHRKNIYRKLGVHTNVELVHYARQHKLL